MFLKLAPSAACVVGEEGEEGEEEGRDRSVCVCGEDGGRMIFKITAPLICDIQEKHAETSFRKSRSFFAAPRGETAHTRSSVLMF